MAAGDLIDFDVIEGQKENIQSLPGGRSAKKLAEVFSSSTQKTSTASPADTRNINECIRAEYEAEVENLSESDDPLDVFDRYVRWTFDAYPSAQATPQSQLHTLLERATKTFIGSPQYKNDPRYLKLWLHYIHFFSDSPRETFVFLSRHSIGEGLALFYEEYAAWLESAGRWSQAEEVYKLGIEREARPMQRLVRKFGEFEKRRAHRPEDAEEPSSPALPSVRPALAAKVDPFAAAAARPVDPQAPRPNMGVGGQSSKPSKSKLAIFSDASSTQPAIPAVADGAKGWDTIGSLADRKKENTVEARPWAGETLKTSIKKSNGPKMAVFRDQCLARIAESHITIAPSKHQVILNPQSGRRERIHVNLEAIYPVPEEPGTELSFEEIWASHRGWLDARWDDESLVDIHQHEEAHDVAHDVADENSPPVEVLSKPSEQKFMIHRDTVTVALDENGAIKDHAKPAKARKKKVMEVNETQVIKANLDSPSGPKIKKKRAVSSEPTMTMHTRAATDEIYDIFNAPLKSNKDEMESDDDDYMTDGDYTSEAESNGTTRQIGTSEAGDGDDVADNRSVSEWPEYAVQEQAPKIDGETEQDHGDDGESELSDLIDAQDTVHQPDYEKNDDAPLTPEDSPPRTRTRYIPIPPEDYEPPTLPYRDPVDVANSRLPFMTPIAERTESSVNMYAEDRSEYYSRSPSGRDALGATAEEGEEDDEDFEPLSSSPLRALPSDVLSPEKDEEHEIFSPMKIAQPQLLKSSTSVIPKGPIIKEAQCNPVDDNIREEILSKMHPPLSSYSGFYDHRSEKSERGAEIRKFAKAVSKNSKSSNEKTSPVSNPVVLEFPDIMHEYTLKRELGAGAFAPVYLVENSSPEDDEDGVVEMGKGVFATRQRTPLEALKMEQPPTAWEFYIMRLAADRLGPQHRASASISAANELHLYQDECFLMLPFHPYPTLLSVINYFREQPSGIMDETLAMFFTIELLRTVEALHSKQIMHGDLKADNCILRLDDAPLSLTLSQTQDQTLSPQWSADGSGGWSTRGIVLIDFGRGIDMRAFGADVQFVADWKTTKEDCAEVREGRPWTWQLDYHGLAGIVHCLLFGKYIDTVRADQGGLGTAAGGRKYKIRESLKRYWQTDIWADCFDLLLNPASHSLLLPVTPALKAVRERMEGWLEDNSEKGIGLRVVLGRVETWAKSRKY